VELKPPENPVVWPTTSYRQVVSSILTAGSDFYFYLFHKLSPLPLGGPLRGRATTLGLGARDN
jgi:hypothetical protein